MPPDSTQPLRPDGRLRTSPRGQRAAIVPSPILLRPELPLGGLDFELDSGVIARPDARLARGTWARRALGRASVLLVTLLLLPLVAYMVGLMILVTFPLLPFVGFLFSGSGRVATPTIPPTRSRPRHPRPVLDVSVPHAA